MIGKQFKSKSEEASFLKDQLARALADYDNLRRRVETEKSVWTEIASKNLIVKLLPVLDILESAEKHLKDSGLAIAINEFKRILIEDGLEEIMPKSGDKFDHNLEEAIESVMGGEKGKISEVILSGWKFKSGQVIRVAKVKVFRGK